MQERLQKLIAQAGVSSRRHAEELIQAGRVTINGVTVTSLGSKADRAHDRITVDGKLLSPELIVVYALYKPVGVVSTAAREAAHPTVMGLIPAVPRVYPVGRLDRMTEGLLLLTNDGELALKLTHPRYQHRKVYELTGTTSVVIDQLIQNFARGIHLKDGFFKPDEVKFAGFRAGQPIVRITLHVGRSHLLRRVASRLGFEITRLKRLQMGTVTLGQLAPGRFRRLSDWEIEKLRS